MDAASEIKQRLSIEEVVGDVVELKRSGSNFKGLCPFHTENTPSFMVNPEKGIYHCFGCSEGGDHFEFVMKMDGLTFPEAVEKLAQKAGVELSQYNKGSASLSNLKKRLKDAHTLAAKYYQQSLLSNKQALDYIVSKRHFNKHTIEDFSVGYAPRHGTALKNFLLKHNFSEKELEQAGLIAKRRDGYLDMFFGRVVVALSDSQGQLIGFTGRVLDDGMPKYLNTSQTPIYDKSRHVFGLAQAKDAIRKQDLAVVVEGNLDVLASHQIDCRNVVATAGTALTIHQIKQIARFTNNIAFAFDQDKAGMMATMRAIPIAQKAGVHLSIIDVDSGKDPDELIQKDPRHWQKLTNSSQYVLDWLFEQMGKNYNLQTATGKANFSSKLIPVISSVNDPIEQEHYMKLLAEKTDSSASAVERKMATGQYEEAKSVRTKQAKYHVDIVDDRKTLEENLLAIIIADPEVKSEININSDIFSIDRRPLYEAKTLPKDDKYANILRFKAEELYKDWTRHQLSREAQELITRLTKKSKDQKQALLTEAIRNAEERGDAEEVERLLKKYQSEIN